jgi:hypothetical protein
MFRLLCPKCSCSMQLTADKCHSLSPATYLHCRCGYVIYGTSAMDAFIQTHYDIWHTAAKCSWEPCMNNRKQNTKYCGRACSNSNARSAYKARQKTG